MTSSRGETSRGGSGVESSAPAHEWRHVGGRTYQIMGGFPERPEDTDAREGTRGTCAPGMVDVRGRMKTVGGPDAELGALDVLQLQTCTNWIRREFPERCAEYDRDKWLELSRDLPTMRMAFCIDRFEYPNRKGVYPYVQINWYDARDRCAAEGKRLCTETEWTFACEGEEAMPYPNGYVRDPDACVNDKPWRKFDDGALGSTRTDVVAGELDKLWQGVPSGSRAKCKSPFAVYDLTGNVDEWTRSKFAGERPSILKGGYWGPVRTRCRPSTRAHGETHAFYQQGFRCCSDAKEK
ncbi:MAG: SUMF1/EgtB/PvdO family nonheme iron enzyme [Polyangiaceae bacterium]